MFSYPSPKKQNTRDLGNTQNKRQWPLLIGCLVQGSYPWLALLHLEAAASWLSFSLELEALAVQQPELPAGSPAWVSETAQILKAGARSVEQAGLELCMQ